MWEKTNGVDFSDATSGLMRMCFFLLVQGGKFPSHGVLFHGFKKKKEGQSVFSASSISYVPLIQNNEYAKVAYFGVICFGFLEYQRICTTVKGLWKICDLVDGNLQAQNRSQ